MKPDLLLISLIIALSSCAAGGTLDITGDMSRFLAQKGLADVSLKCSLLGTGVTPGPEGMCLLPMTDTDVRTIVSTLDLEPKSDSVISWQPTSPDCWIRLDLHDQSVDQWYVSPLGDPICR